MTGEVGPQRGVPEEEGGPDPTEDPILYLADQGEEEEG